MENLHIEKGRNTPAVIFKTDGELRIEGNSICENSLAFYTPPLEWLKEFEKTNPQKVTCHVNLEYFNSSSSLLLIKLFTLLSQIGKSGAQTNIIWYYPEEDEDMIEAGQNFSRIIKVPFNFQSISSQN
jgi:hypothetical protein